MDVPHLATKLDRLLCLNGRNQKWLAACLSVTEPAVSNWKAAGRLPALHAVALCRLLGIEQSLLETDDFGAFARRLDDAFAPGSGRRWQGLVRAGVPAARVGLPSS